MSWLSTDKTEKRLMGKLVFQQRLQAVTWLIGASLNAGQTALCATHQRQGIKRGRRAGHASTTKCA